MRKARGFTLIEIAVYCALVGMALLAIYSVLIACLTYFNATQANVDLQRSCLSILTKLSSELSESDSATVQISTDPPGISFASPRDSGGNFDIASGVMQWQQFVAYYVDTSNVTLPLVRKAASITPTGSVPTSQLSSYTVSAFSTMNAQQHTLGDNVTTFTPSLSGSTVSISIVADERDPTGAIMLAPSGVTANEIQVTASGVYLRN